MEILVVDDELAIRKGLAALLEESGYSVCTARDGKTYRFGPQDCQNATPIGSAFWYNTKQRNENMGDTLKVYLESSFISNLTGGSTANAKIAADQAFTRQWWLEEKSKCDICASRFVVDESEDGCAEAVARRMEVLKTIPVLKPDDAKVADLAAKLISGHAVPESQATDALHIAAAAVIGADVLLTWNCKHMANPHTLPKTRQIVTAAGYVCPQVMTPKTFLDNLNMEAENA